MKLLETISYSGDRFGILVNHILAIQPNPFKRGEDNFDGCSIIMQNESPDGTTFIVRESYDVIKAKLEAIDDQLEQSMLAAAATQEAFRRECLEHGATKGSLQYWHRRAAEYLSILRDYPKGQDDGSWVRRRDAAIA